MWLNIEQNDVSQYPEPSPRKVGKEKRNDDDNDEMMNDRLY